MILTYANIVCLAKLVCLTIVTINNIYWIQKNSIEICTSFGFEPLHQKMYYSFILSSEFKKWKKEMARSLCSHWLVGFSTSVLKEDFVSSYHHGDSLVDAEPFSGKIRLPTIDISEGHS